VTCKRARSSHKESW